MTIDRRKLFALSGVGVLVAGGTGAHGPEISPGKGGITVQLSYQSGEWVVAVPDWEGVPDKQSPVYGYLMPMKWMVLSEFLSELKEVTKLQ